MKKEKSNKESFLRKIPLHKEGLKWSRDDNGIVVLEIENKGLFNKLAQIILKKPKVSYIHLDETGSFIWSLIDGEKDIQILGKLVDEHFGEKAHPLYERLSQYIKILESYGFIAFK